MPHLEGVLTLVTGSGPWVRIQGRHIRDGGGFTVNVNTDPHSGITVDVHTGGAAWIRFGWFPRHTMCKMAAHNYPVGGLVHRCWARRLNSGTFDLAQWLRAAGSR